MSNISNPLITNNPLSEWMQNVAEVTRQHDISSKDLDVITTTYGSSVSLKNNHKYVSTAWNYRGEYDPEIAYSVNDVVRVLPDVTYSLPWDATPTKNLLSDTPQIFGDFNGRFFIMDYYIPVPGTYICVVPVPAFVSLLQLLNLNIFSGNPAWDVTATGTYEDAFSIVKKNINAIRFNDVNYYPVYPEMPEKATFDPTDLSKYKGRYWELVSLLPGKHTVCENGKDVTIYSDTQLLPTGSANYVPPV